MAKKEVPRGIKFVCIWIYISIMLSFVLLPYAFKKVFEVIEEELSKVSLTLNIYSLVSLIFYIALFLWFWVPQYP